MLSSLLKTILVSIIVEVMIKTILVSIIVEITIYRQY